MSRIRQTLPVVVEALDHLLDTGNDRQAARRLNELGHRNWKGEPFSEKKVSLVRRTYGLKSRLERLRARSFLTGAQLAQRLGVSTTTIHNWGRASLLQRELYGNATRCLYAPLEASVPVKGRGGRQPTPPTLINVSSSSQEIV
jgi:DNA-binding transcriptional regulator YiaG